MNGHLAAEIILIRGKEYRIRVQGGANPHNPTDYHPLIITGEYSF